MFATRNRDRSNRGFSVIELLTVVAVLAVLVTVSYPSMQDLVMASRLRSASSDFYADLLAARSEAIKRRVNVSLSPSGGAWTGGWSVAFGGSTLANHEALPATVQVQVNVPASVTTNPVTYGSNGRVSAGAQTVIFYIPGRGNVQARCVGIAPSGLPNIRTDTNGDATDGCN